MITRPSAVARLSAAASCLFLLALSAPVHAQAPCRGTKLLHACTPDDKSGFSAYYSCYAVQVPCSLEKYSLEGVFSPFKYPIVSNDYYVPRDVVLHWELTER